MSGPKLKAAALTHLDTHRAMDVLFHFVETNPHVKQHMAQVFHTGIAKAIFDSWKDLTPAARTAALSSVKAALETATSAPSASALPRAAKAVFGDLVEVLRQLADPVTDAELKVKGGNREGFYTEVAKYMAKSLEVVNKAAKRKKK